MNNLEIKVQELEKRVSELEKSLSDITIQLDKPKRDQSFGDDKPTQDKRDSRFDLRKRSHEHNKQQEGESLQIALDNAKKIQIYLSDGDHRTLDEIKEASGLGKKTIMKALSVSRLISGDGHSDSRKRKYHLTKGDQRL